MDKLKVEVVEVHESRITPCFVAYEELGPLRCHPSVYKKGVDWWFIVIGILLALTIACVIFLRTDNELILKLLVL